MDAADVLVVEDAPEFARVIAAVVQLAGHRVRVATTIADTVAAVDAALPDLVILDLTLPDGDGLELCRHLRARCTTPILVVSGRNTPLDVLVAAELGASDYLVKPFAPLDLAARVESLLEASRPGCTVPPVSVVDVPVAGSTPEAHQTSS